MELQIKYNKCYIIRHAERFDFKYSLDWLIKSLLSYDVDFYDTPITKKGFINAYRLGKYMYLYDYFVPDIIYCSPYLRCKQTATAIKYIYKKIGYDINIVVDALLREAEYDEINENLLDERINNIYNKLINSGKKKNPVLVTHGTIVYNLSNIYDRSTKISSNYLAQIFQTYCMNYLSTCVFDNKGNTYRYF